MLQYSPETPICNKQLKEKAIFKTTIISTIALIILGSIIYLNIFKLPKKQIFPIGEPFNLISHKGDPITEKIFSTKPTILFFGFTNCPEVCPTTLYEISSWIDELNLSNKEIQTIFITLDPQRDTVNLMDEYLSNFNDVFLGLTGDENDIIQLSKSWGIYRKVVPTSKQDYSLDHTSTIFLINKDRSLGGTIAFREASEVAIAKIKNLIERNS